MKTVLGGDQDAERLGVVVRPPLPCAATRTGESRSARTPINATSGPNAYARGDRRSPKRPSITVPFPLVPLRPPARRTLVTGRGGRIRTIALPVRYDEWAICSVSGIRDTRRDP